MSVAAGGYVTRMAEGPSTGGDRDWTDVESEGLPDLEGQPPGIGPENAVEGITPPADHLLGAEDPDVTAAGQAVPETLQERVLREQPDRLGGEVDPDGRLVAGQPDGSGEELGTWETDDAAALSPEERAVHLTGE